MVACIIYAQETILTLTKSKPSLIERCSQWWSSLGAWQQEMIATLTPLLAVTLFLLATFAVFLHLKSEETSRETQMLARETYYSLERITALLHVHQEELSQFAEDIHIPVNAENFTMHAREIMTLHPDVQRIMLVNDAGQLEQVYAAPWLSESMRRVFEPQWLQGASSAVNAPNWVVQTLSKASEENKVLHLFNRIGTANDHGPTRSQWLVLEVSPEALLRAASSIDAHPLNYSMRLLTSQEASLVGQEKPKKPLSFLNLLTRDWMPPAQMKLPVSPFGQNLQLVTQVYRTDSGLTDRSFIWLIFFLAGMTLIMLVVNWRLSRRRFQTQRQLLAESSFRRAIEDAMSSGIRVLDMQGRTTYSNATFSRMIGWSQEELTQMAPPYPYWPEEDKETLMERFSAELDGKHQPGGMQLRMKHKNGSLIDTRVFITPLINDARQQTGWLTTINDITEPNRIRQQLATAQDRVTLVLEAMDASISVTPLGSRELLFANKLYRQWFGSLSDGHLKMLARAGAVQAQQSEAASDDEDGLMGLPTENITSARAEQAEIYIERLDKWIEVRSRYLDWVDGRLAQMIIATDITVRKQTEEQAAKQAEQVQNVSRLITMGEMASSVAHELNQPLAAISNYSNGMISRIKSGSITLEGLIAPLEKTAHQAVRAGQVILRIREFVRRSAPKRDLCEVQRIVNEALEIVSIELRKRDVRIVLHLESHLPMLLADAILIEQVLINLLKNSAEAIDGAQLSAERRQIDLTVNAADQGIRFILRDKGPGIPEDVVEHLFEAFYSTKNDGLGIGLNLCRSIVESHHGKISVRNLYNETQALAGCEFSFWLPSALHPSSRTRPLPGQDS